MFGAIEAGGTKFVCAVGTNPGDLRNEIRFPTTSPEKTITQAIEYFKEQNLIEKLHAIGIGSFGPVDLNPDSPTYGYITSTPKPGWKNTNILGKIREALNIPVGFDTDVNAAALGEFEWGAAQDLNDFIYLTIGTGIGGGGFTNGKIMRGLLHPEMGHILLPHDFAVDPYPGKCPFHGDCFEGMAAGPAIEARWQEKGQNLGDDHPAWELEAHYIALALINYICILSPQRIILGGGVMDQPRLLPLIQEKVKSKLNGYFQTPEIEQNIEAFIVKPGLGNRAGILGGFALAKRTYEKES